MVYRRKPHRLKPKLHARSKLFSLDSCLVLSIPGRPAAHRTSGTCRAGSCWLWASSMAAARATTGSILTSSTPAQVPSNRGSMRMRHACHHAPSAHTAEPLEWRCRHARCSCERHCWLLLLDGSVDTHTRLRCSGSFLAHRWRGAPAGWPPAAPWPAAARSAAETCARCRSSRRTPPARAPP